METVAVAGRYFFQTMKQERIELLNAEKSCIKTNCNPWKSPALTINFILFLVIFMWGGETGSQTIFPQGMTYQQTSEERLRQTIERLPEVMQATVHLYLPQLESITGEEQEAKTSVILKLRPDIPFTAELGEKISFLIANRVPGLNPQNVTIKTIYGSEKFTSELGDDLSWSDALQSPNAQLSFQQAFENNLARRIEYILERVLGPNKVVATVSAELDFSRIVRVTNNFEQSAPRQEKRIVTTQDEAKVLKGFIKKESPSAREEEEELPGLPKRGELPGLYNRGLLSKTDYQSKDSLHIYPTLSQTESVIDYELDKTTERIISAPGSIKKLFALVFVDQKYQPVKDINGGETREYVARAKEEMATYLSLVKQVLSYDEERGDRIEIAEVPFDTTVSERLEQEKKELQRLQRRQFWASIAKNVVMIVLIMILPLFFFILILRIMKERRKKMGHLQSEAITPEQISAHIREQIIQTARTDPNYIARALKNWLAQ